MDRKTMHVVAERLIFKAGSLVEFWGDEFEQFGEEPPCTAEEARVLLARWLQRLPGDAWDTRLDERKVQPDLSALANRQKAAPETVAEINAARCRDCKGAGCPVCGYSGQDANRKIADAGRLSLGEALEYADQMRRDATCVGLPNWPEPLLERVASCTCPRSESEVYAAHHRTVCLAATCKHGNTPRSDVTGDPVKACAEAGSTTEWGAFNGEGCTYAYDCAVDVANESARQNEEAESTPDDPESRWHEMCRDHRDQEQPKDGCEECNAEIDD